MNTFSRIWDPAHVALFGVCLGVVAVSCYRAETQHTPQRSAAVLERDEVERIAYNALAQYEIYGYKIFRSRHSDDGRWHVVMIPAGTDDIPVGSQKYVTVFSDRSFTVEGGL